MLATSLCLPDFCDYDFMTKAYVPLTLELPHSLSSEGQTTAAHTQDHSESGMKPFTYPGFRKKVLVSAAIFAAFIGVTTFVVMHRAPKGGPAAGGPQAVLTVTTATLHRAVWPSTLEISGAVAPWQEAIISAQISGYQITDVLANVGDEVKKGQVLARINPDLLRADEAVLRANFEQAEANYKRAVSLQANGFMSEQNILLQETQMKTSRALLDSKRLQIRYTDVIAPDNGAISARTATLGNVVNTGQELFRLVRQNRLEWRGEVSAKQLPQVSPGQVVRLMLPDGSLAKATVRQSAPMLSTESRLAFVYADVETSSAARAGMYATGRITLGESTALAAPAEAIVLRDGRSYVFEIVSGATGENAAKAALRAVTIGRREGDEVEILSGLSETARVVVRGSAFLNDGDIVRIVDSGSPAAPTR